MNIVTSFHSQAHGAALVEVSFPESVPCPAPGQRGTMLSPRDTWMDLAKEKAAELGVEIGFREIEGGLKVTFHTHEDCSHVLAAMEPEWPERLRQGLGYWVRLQFRAAEQAADRGEHFDPKPGVERLAQSYALEFEDLADLGERSPNR